MADWPTMDAKDGVFTTTLKLWSLFHDVVAKTLDYPGNFKGEEQKITLLKVLIPYSERTACLKALHVMNVNHATLFPDLYGAGKLSTELLRRAIA